MKRILAAIDFSGVSEAIVDQAVSLTEAFSSELVLLHVAAPDPDFVGYGVGPPSVRGGRAHTLRSEHEELQQTAEGLRQRGITAKSLLVQGPTIDEIPSLSRTKLRLDQANRLKTDLIILGSHGHAALHRALLGSVSEGVLRAATCPILIVPSRRSAAPS